VGCAAPPEGGDHTLTALKTIRATRPDGAPIYAILDNLSANKTPAIGDWAARHKVELCLTPASTSWADPIEAQFGPRRAFTMASSDTPTTSCWPETYRPAYAGATRMPATPMSSPLHAANGPAAAANATNAGAAPTPKPTDQAINATGHRVRCADWPVSRPECC
jgi:hypothetical protein